MIMKKILLFSLTACLYIGVNAQKRIINDAKKQSTQKLSNLLHPSSENNTQGCLENSGEEYPFTEFIPECMGNRETITENGVFGEYSIIKIVNKGATYTFSTDVPTAQITIANAEGDTVLASGLGSVTWTSTYVGKIRFITHIDSECTPSNDKVSKFIQCGSAVTIANPNFSCFQGDGLFSNNSENGMRIGDAHDTMAADDFDVQEGDFNVQQIRLNVISELPIKSIRFLFKEDMTNKPGNTLYDISIAPSFTRKIGTAQQGYPVYELTFDLENALKFTPGKYWMVPLASSEGFTYNIFWESTSLGKNGNISMVSDNSGETWSSSTYQQVFFIAGECMTLGTADNNLNNTSIYPNPVFDFLNIKTENTLEAITIYDLSGRQVMRKEKISNNQINISTLSKGTYIVKLEVKEKQTETFKIIKK